MSKDNHVYIDKNLRHYGNVNGEWASRYASDRVFNSNNMVCPTPNYVDPLGRPSDKYALNTETAGCSNATLRTNVEDEQRPSKFSNIRLSDIGISGRFDCDTTPIMVQQPLYSDDRRSYYSTQMRENQWNQLTEKVQYYKSLSGMGDFYQSSYTI